MYINDNVYTPAELGISWGDIKGAAEKGLESAKSAYDSYKEAQVRAKVAAEQMKAKQLQQQQGGFMQKYGVIIAIAGVGLVAVLLLRKKK